MDEDLHSQLRRLIELRMAHAELDVLIDRLAELQPQDELGMRRLKKQRLGLRDQISRLEMAGGPDERA